MIRDNEIKKIAAKHGINTELVRSYWSRGLAHQMKDLPKFDVALKELRTLIARLFRISSP